MFGQFLRCNFSERIIEEERNIIRTLEVSEVTHRFGGGDTGLEGISFALTRGELVCVMGASGSGKSHAAQSARRATSDPPAARSS